MRWPEEARCGSVGVPPMMVGGWGIDLGAAIGAAAVGAIKTALKFMLADLAYYDGTAIFQSNCPKQRE